MGWEPYSSICGGDDGGGGRRVLVERAYIPVRGRGDLMGEEGGFVLIDDQV